MEMFVTVIIFQCRCRPEGIDVVDGCGDGKVFDRGQRVTSGIFPFFGFGIWTQVPTTVVINATACRDVFSVSANKASRSKINASRSSKIEV